MMDRFARLGFVLMASGLVAVAQEGGEAPPAAPPAAPAPSPEETAPASPEVSPEEGAPAAPAEVDRDAVRSLDRNEKVKTLRPEEIPLEVEEMGRLRSKADIKAEISLKTQSGRPVNFKGVIRNGKLIEILADKKFVPQASLEDPKCGVRLWWSGDSDGYIFFRYSNIQTITLTGKLTDEERREIERRLKARREGQKEPEKQATPIPDEEVEADLEKLSPDALKDLLLTRYPYNKGWNHDRLRDLNRQQVLESKVLSRDESIFVKYSQLLFLWHFEELKQDREKFNLEPGSDKPAVQPGSGQPKPAQPVPPVDNGGDSGDDGCAEGDVGGSDTGGDDFPPFPEEDGGKPKED